MTKCSKNKLIQNFIGRKQLFRLEKREKKLEKDKKRQDSIIKDVKNIFKLKKWIDDNTIKLKV